MPQYLISVYDQPDTRSRPQEDVMRTFQQVDAVNQRMVAEGVFVFAGGLHDQSMSTHVDASSGTPVVSDGPYLETKEYIGGFWVLECADLDAALEWAKQATVACELPLEVRPFMSEPPEGV